MKSSHFSLFIFCTLTSQILAQNSLNLTPSKNTETHLKNEPLPISKTTENAPDPGLSNNKNGFLPVNDEIGLSYNPNIDESVPNNESPLASNDQSVLNNESSRLNSGDSVSNNESPVRNGDETANTISETVPSMPVPSTGTSQGRAEGIYSSNSMLTAVILTFLFTVLALAAFYWWWNRRKSLMMKERHLVLETDPEKGGKSEYAFDNPGFKDATLIATSEKSPKLESKHKWTHWSPLSALTLTRTEKKRALDDSQIDQSQEVKVVALKSHDFTGLGFSICGNMKDGIYIKDILHRGPAFESGKLNIGDRINSVTISFEHMVYEDALTILSYASPYEVMLEAKCGRIQTSAYAGQGGNPNHPLYRSSSYSDLYSMEKSSKKKLFGDDYSSGSNYSSLQKSRSNMTTLERKESKSPRCNMPKSKKQDKSPQKLTPDLLKTHFEEKVTIENSKIKENVHKFENELQKTENKPQKFGIRVLPTENHDKSPKIKEQNENNLNIERHMEETPQKLSIDEVDKKVTPPQPRKREKKSPEGNFERNDSNIKRDKNGIPLEVPEHMMGAAVAAKRNRKSSVQGLVDEDDAPEQSKKPKGRAPHPPIEKFDDTQSVEESRSIHSQESDGNTSCITKSDRAKFLISDSEEERTLSSVNTIELNSSDVTIHQNEEEENRAARKTASTGDLSKMNKKSNSNGTLERAQSLDNTETNSSSNLVKKKIFDESDNLLIDREPRLSLILDGLNTFQRNRLKKSTEWCNLEDAILNLGQDSGEWEYRRKSEPHFNAVMDRVKQIKRESQEIDVPESVVLKYRENRIEVEENLFPKVKNQIWPTDIDEEIKPQWKKPAKKIPPVALERNSLKTNEDSLSKSLDKDIQNLSNGKYDLSPKKGDKPFKFNVKTKAALFDSRAEDDNVARPTSGLKRASPSMTLNFEPHDSPHTKTSPTSKSPFTLNFKQACEADEKQLKVESDLLMEYYKDGIFPITVSESEMLSKPEIPLRSIPDRNRSPECQQNMIKDEWELAEENSLNNVSPPQSLTLMDEVMDTFTKNSEKWSPKNEQEPVLSHVNLPDETKYTSETKVATENFLSNEKLQYEHNTNIPDDIKVSRHSLDSLELKKCDLEEKQPVKRLDSPSKTSEVNQKFNFSPKPFEKSAPIQFDFKPKVVEKESLIFKPKVAQVELKSDDSKVDNLIVSHVTVTENGNSNLHSLELSINEPSELYTTALEKSEINDDIKLDKTSLELQEEEVGIVENNFSKICEKPVQKNGEQFDVDIVESKYLKLNVESPKLNGGIEKSSVKSSQKTSLDIDDTLLDDESLELDPRLNDEEEDPKMNFVTEIQVVNGDKGSNISEIEILSNGDNSDHLENAFENYVKNFESKLENFESNMQNFENKLEEFVREEPKSLILEEEKSDIEKQVSKIQEIAEEQLKRLPEMRFSTASYESQGGRKTPEKRHSFELLRSNFEKSDKSPPKTQGTPPRSRIPISTTMKTPPMSPERRDSRNLENENDRAILELMSSSVHSTPFVSKIKPPTPTRSLSEIEFTSRIKPPTPTKNLSEVEFTSKLRSPSTSIKNLTEIEYSGSKLRSPSPSTKNLSEIEFTSKIKPPSTPTKNVTVTSIRNNSKIPSGLPTFSGRPPIAPRKSDEGLNGSGDSSFKQWVFNPNNNVTNVSVGKDK